MALQHYGILALSDFLLFGTLQILFLCVSMYVCNVFWLFGWLYYCMIQSNLGTSFKAMNVLCCCLVCLFS